MPNNMCPSLADTKKEPEIIRTVAALKQWRAQQGSDVALVPTMGALHQGHGHLIQAARQAHEHVVVSIFVNPLQFANLGACDDYENYPRNDAADIALLTELEVDTIFIPTVEEMYPGGFPEIWVRTGEMGSRLEGASRPGHFDGVATVVSKLFHLIQPHVAYFGQKDAQQVAIIKRMVSDLNLPIAIETVPIVRSTTGLAESSRNQRLSDIGKQQAVALSQTLFTAAAQYPDLQLDALRAQLAESPGVTLDYLTLVRAANLQEVPELTDAAQEECILLVAAWVEGIRLIDAQYLPQS